MRLARLSTFFTNSLVIFLAVGLAVCSYLIGAKNSPFGYSPFFPRTLYICLIVLTALLVVCGALGCGNGYKPRLIPVILYTTFLFGILIYQVYIGVYAYTIPALTAEEALAYWNDGDDEYRNKIMNDLRCCGYKNVTERASTCPILYFETCDQKLLQAKDSQTKTVSYVLWGTALLVLGALISSTLLIAATIRKRREKKEKLLLKRDNSEETVI